MYFISIIKNVSIHIYELFYMFKKNELVNILLNNVKKSIIIYYYKHLFLLTYYKPNSYQFNVITYLLYFFNMNHSCVISYYVMILYKNIML